MQASIAERAAAMPKKNVEVGPLMSLKHLFRSVGDTVVHGLGGG